MKNGLTKAAIFQPTCQTENLDYIVLRWRKNGWIQISMLYLASIDISSHYQKDCKKNTAVVKNYQPVNDSISFFRIKGV